MAELGEVLDGRYRVVGSLGEGSVGAVYEVEHLQLGRRFALKLLFPHWVAVAGVADRFAREARLAAQIDSPYVAQATDFGQHQLQPFIVMELLRGQTLKQWLQTGPSVSLILKRMVDVLNGLSAAHQRGITHRDLKPENIFVCRPEIGGGEIVGGEMGGGGGVKILDFGIAKVAEPTDEIKTATGSVFGTPRYMAPEQAAGDQVDHRADLYAFGTILFEALAGRPPFEAASAGDLLRKQIVEQPPKLHLPSFEGSVAETLLRDLIEACLRKEPSARPPSAGAVRAALEGVAEELAARGEPPVEPAARGESPVEPAAPQAPVKSALKPGDPAWWGSVMVMVAVLGFALARGPSTVPLSISKVPPSTSATGEPVRAEPAGTTSILPPKQELPPTSVEAEPVKDRDLSRVLVDGTPYEQASLQSRVEQWIRQRDVSQLKRVLASARSVAFVNATDFSTEVLIRLAQKGISFRMRRRAYEGLERSGRVHELNRKAFLLEELKSLRTDRCETRKWYVRRLAALRDPSTKQVLLQERNRRGGFLDLEVKGRCLRDLVDSAVQNM